jgi:hypothetical protein
MGCKLKELMRHFWTYSAFGGDFVPGSRELEKQPERVRSYLDDLRACSESARQA